MEMDKKTLATLFAKIEALQQTVAAESPPQTTGNRLLKFNEKEIIQMPTFFRKTFRAQGCTAHVRKRTDGRYNCSYEIRYAKKPYNKRPISASGTTLEEAKARFIEKLKNYNPEEVSSFPTIPKDFDGFALYWFENFHKRKVCDTTYKHDIKLYNRHIKENFISAKLDKITPLQFQSLLDRFSDKGKTADDIFSLLNQILNCAVKHGMLRLNPLGMCFHRSHVRKNGTALTMEEEKQLLAFFSQTPYLPELAVVLYTGLRPNEYKTAAIEAPFIKAENSKRKSGKRAFKKIPITPMLRPYVCTLENLAMPSIKVLSSNLKNVLPAHTLYDLRTTFQTRCTECGISDTAIGLFMGNSIGNALKETYTDVSDEWLISEGEKLKY